MICPKCGGFVFRSSAVNGVIVCEWCDYPITEGI